EHEECRVRELARLVEPRGLHVAHPPGPVCGVFEGVDIDEPLVRCIKRLVSQDELVDIHEGKHKMRHHRDETDTLLWIDALVSQVVEHGLFCEVLATRCNVCQYSFHIVLWAMG